MTGTRRRVIIGVCGIDGVGRSTLISRLSAWPALRAAATAAMPSGANYRRMLRMHPGIWQRPADLIGTPLSRAMGWAELFDVLRYQQRTIGPSLDTPGVLLHDRWTLCWTAFGRSVAGLGAGATDRLRRVAPADLVIYLDASPETALERICTRRNPRPDEDIAVFRALRAGYDAAYPEQTGSVVRIADGHPDVVERAAKESITRVLRDTLQNVFRDGTDGGI